MFVCLLAQEKSIQEDIKDKSVTDVANDSKVEESPSSQKDEKKEKVKKKRSFRSFSFLRREKKTKEENNKNGDVAKEVRGSLFALPSSIFHNVTGPNVDGHTFHRSFSLRI